VIAKFLRLITMKDQRRILVLAAICGSSVLLQGCGDATPDSTPDTSDLVQCTSSRTLPLIVKPEKKGFCVDDLSMEKCADKLVAVWPHAAQPQPVTSFRLFAAWKPTWNESLREESWQNLNTYLKTTNGQILLGTEVFFLPDGTLDHEANDQMFAWALDLMKILGKERIMGLSVGNEIDNNNDPDPNNPNNPKNAFWETDYFNIIKNNVDAMDLAGFTDVPITAVWSMGAPSKFEGMLQPLLSQAQDLWKERWVWSFNPYPIWDVNVQPASAEECADKVAVAIGLDYTKTAMTNVRNNVRDFVGNGTDFTLWVTESGWSSPGVFAIHEEGEFDPQAGQTAVMAVCPLWGSEETLYTFYKNMMEWDLSLGTRSWNGDEVPDINWEDSHSVDHLFYFTMRDTINIIGGNIHEGFGLISGCEDTACKIEDTPTLV